ncbi:DUF4231 domain-containing protein [Lactococcus raffinolactis]|uniref:DUF4231 domain-containing protein n=1 Tax=Pseudolactococcus raffinolactis TaxID=1366 RepID=A0AAE6YK93_9LACT|nr:DUF4231 domain-containing protein [Lactococcus raffinolactis]QIW57864.1 DUF4231 domain-containing protein [Lactococcus raffinolactis]
MYKDTFKIYSENYLKNYEINYLQDRVDEQISWYDSKSQSSQKSYKIWTYIILIASALIPISVNLLPINIYTKIITSLLGIFSTIAQGIINLNDDNTNWVEYRKICETLKKEKYMFLYAAGVYEIEENRFAYFVERIESIISQENVNWANIKKRKQGELNET